MDRRANHLQLRLLGGVELRSDRASDAPAPGRKVRALLAYLALNADLPCPREKLMALLWSDRAEEQARASLRQALTELRHALGEPSPLRTEQDTVSLDSSAITVDAVEFPRLAKAGKLAEAAALYRGSLLDGHGVRDGGFEDWLLVERMRLHDLAIDTLHRLAASQAGDAAIGTAQRLLQLEPVREESYRLLMRLYAAAGQRTQALRQYQLCRDALQRELQAKPDAETERLYREIQDDLAPVVAPATMPEKLHPSDGKPSIAVLPFNNMSGDPEQEYFSDGITEDIITELSRFRSLFVIARNSSFQYKGRTSDIRQVAGELGVRFVLEGSVRKAGKNIRVTVQLIDALAGNHLWAERYDRALEDVFQVQDEIVEKIVMRLENRLALAVAEQARRKPPQSMTAYECFLQARHHLSTSYDWETAEPLVRQAIQLDPEFARAHIALAWCRVHHYYFEPRHEYLDEALVSATRAVELDENEALAETTLAVVYTMRREFDLAGIHFDRTLKMNSNDVEVIINYCFWLCALGRFEESLKRLDDVLQREPTPPNYYWDIRFTAALSAGRFQDAIDSVAQRKSDLYYYHAYLAAAYAQLGQADRARSEVDKLMRMMPECTIRLLMEAEPFRNPADAEPMIEGYRKAGIPE